MGAHTRDEDIGAARYRSVVGSTMQKVAKSARCPVVIISRPCTTCWKLFSNIVVGTDFSKPATSSFLWAARLAKEVNARLHIFHAVDINASEPGKVKGQAEIESTSKRRAKKSIPNTSRSSKGSTITKSASGRGRLTWKFSNSPGKNRPT
jgi:nucleotide-binding universal stress UspA family protein